MSEDLHGSAPDSSAVVVLLLDVINDFEHEDGEALFRDASVAAPRIAELKRRAGAAGVPVVYANDNFGRWRSNQEELLEHCRGSRGAGIAGLLAPGDADYFVLKPKHSAFFETSLPILLAHLQARTLVLAGWTTDICVLFSAIDAYMRGYGVVLAADAVAAVRPEHTSAALAYAGRVLEARIREVGALDFGELAAVAGER